MIYKIKLKNSDDTVRIDDRVYEWITSDPYLLRVDFLNNLRRHSSGCVVFQKTWKKADGEYKTDGHPWENLRDVADHFGYCDLQSQK